MLSCALSIFISVTTDASGSKHVKTNRSVFWQLPNTVQDTTGTIPLLTLDCCRATPQKNSRIAIVSLAEHVWRQTKDRVGPKGQVKLKKITQFVLVCANAWLNIRKIVEIMLCVVLQACMPQLSMQTDRSNVLLCCIPPENHCFMHFRRRKVWFKTCSVQEHIETCTMFWVPCPGHSIHQSGNVFVQHKIRLVAMHCRSAVAWWVLCQRWCCGLDQDSKYITFLLTMNQWTWFHNWRFQTSRGRKFIVCFGL